jgi:hypothetical protein
VITRHPWFGPKNGFGWGWTPVSWESWAATAICLAVIIGAYLRVKASSPSILRAMGDVAINTAQIGFELPQRSIGPFDRVRLSNFRRKPAHAHSTATLVSPQERTVVHGYRFRN